MEDGLPLVDLSDLSDENAQKLVEAASKHGFLVLKNHLLTREDIDGLFQVSREFFGQSKEVKNEFPITFHNDGYVAPFVENLEQDGAGPGDAKEAFNITHLNLSTFTPNQSLPYVFEDSMELISSCLRKYYVMLHMVCRLLAIGLDIKDRFDNKNPEFFVDAHALDRRTHSTLRFVHYDESDALEAAENKAGAHTDYGSLTFVLQRPNKGLQVFNGEEWLDLAVPLQEDGQEPLIVNIADVLSFWTDGYLKSTLHRVRTKQERYSVVFFCHPSDDTLLEPVNSCLVNQHRGHCYSLGSDGNPITALEHLLSKLKQGYDYQRT